MNVNPSKLIDKDINPTYMFTIDQISAAHGKVKSGSDFPRYIQDVKELGVVRYETFVADGHTVYWAASGDSLKSAEKYVRLAIAQDSNADALVGALKTHQRGETDYMTFCKQAADAGIEKWVVDVTEMTCTYYTVKGKKVLREVIPG